MSLLVKPLTGILGLVLTIVGIVGFFNNPVLGIFEVNTLHNVVHIVSGLAGLWAYSTSQMYSRWFLIIFGVVYGLVTILGFMNSDLLGLGMLMVNDADNYLHLAISAGCLVVGFGSKK